MQKIKIILIGLLLSINTSVYAADFSTLGSIDGSQSASLIVSSGLAGHDIIFGTGYNTPTYQGFYTVPNLSNYYSSPISSPYSFVDATAAGVSFASRPYSVTILSFVVQEPLYSKYPITIMLSIKWGLQPST